LDPKIYEVAKPEVLRTMGVKVFLVGQMGYTEQPKADLKNFRPRAGESFFRNSLALVRGFCGGRFVGWLQASETTSFWRNVSVPDCLPI